MSDTSKIRALEERLLQPDFRRNRAAIAELLADDFREFGSSGRVWTKQQILDHLESEAPFEVEMHDFGATEFAPGVILATYKVTVKNRTSLRSSIWIKRDGRWLVLFHQGTIARSWLDYLQSGAVASPEFMRNVEDLPAQEREL